jgi:hypothetical protein
VEELYKYRVSSVMVKGKGRKFKWKTKLFKGRVEGRDKLTAREEDEGRETSAIFSSDEMAGSMISSNHKGSTPAATRINTSLSFSRCPSRVSSLSWSFRGHFMLARNSWSRSVRAALASYCLVNVHKVRYMYPAAGARDLSRPYAQRSHLY